MAKATGPIAKVENKSGSVSTTKSIPANVSTSHGSNLNAPTAQRTSYGNKANDGGVGFSIDERHTRGREGLFGASQTKTGFTPRSIKQYGASRSVGQTTEVAIGPRPK